jgi:hypothetical protein
MLIILTRFLNAQVSDTTVLLPSVTVVYEENEAELLWRQLSEYWPLYQKQSIESAKLYSRQSTSANEVVFEQVSNIYLNKDLYFQEVIAFKDYDWPVADFGNNVDIQASFSFDGDYDFSQGVDQGTFSKYPYSKFENQCIEPLNRMVDVEYAPSPIAGIMDLNAWSHYTFELVARWESDSSEHATLFFTPRKNRTGWVGQVEVDTRSFRIHQFEGAIGNMEILQQFSSTELFYVDHQRLRWANGSHQVEYWLTEVNRIPSMSDKPRNLVAIIPDQQLQGTDFWAQYRPEDDKLDAWTARQDSIIRYLNSDEYLDSADAVYNEFHWYEPLVSGVGYRKRSAGTHFFYSPLIGQFNAFGVGGWRWTPFAFGTKRFENDQMLSITGRLNYGLTNTDTKGTLGATYTYAPLRNASWTVNVGNDYQQITQSVDLTGLFARSNFIEKTFTEVYHRYEWFNGFYTRLGFEYSKRESIENLDLGNDIFGSLTPPQPFETYTVGQVSAEILIRPYQRYYLKGRRKIVLSSKWPDFRVVFKQGIPNLLNSDVRYSKYEFIVEDYVPSNRLGFSHYRVASGGFLNDPSTVRFIEYKWFRGGDYLLYTHPLYTFQNLPETFATPEVYFMANATHHFEGFLLNRVPLIRRLKLNVALGASMLTIPSRSLMHLETYIGAERKLKLWDQPVRWGMYYGLLPNDMDPGYRIKIGMDFKDTFLDRWNF